MFQSPDYKIYRAQLQKLRAVLVLKLAESRNLSTEELYDVRGQLHNLRVVLNLPNEVEKQLQIILQREKDQREMERLNGISTSVRSGRSGPFSPDRVAGGNTQ
jgi:hypothetical protein